MSRDRDYRRLIGSARWQRLRARCLAARPLCERCQAEGRTRLASEVHHVVPVERGLTAADKARLCYDWHNLRPLCHECHVREHELMGRSGRSQARSAAEARLRQFAERFL